eukprot:CAMPEP_0172825398 /NCGR_PEP_ID=MMETSP1075-20121228/18637_1 /TAXON_ID=2916 /ORGANISM="Ceratium fusus, Strain PA161109" /LENGTH=30 /DNA_ID= /DNA_START= /DNA_END= /DNA_ORIENTATION=
MAASQLLIERYGIAAVNTQLSKPEFDFVMR